VVVNGENAADSGRGITKKISDELLNSGANVITSGNHIWDQKETMNFIGKEKRLLRPINMIEGSPGAGFGIFRTKKNLEIAVVNFMGNIFMTKCDDLFNAAKKFIEEIKKKENIKFIVVDIHGEITSEKMALGHLFDGLATVVVGTHTHVPTMDFRILKKGTAYQTDIGMCGDYDSVIGMNKENSIKKFTKDETAVKHFPALGEATISGVIINADEKTGLAKEISPIFVGGVLQERN